MGVVGLRDGFGEMGRLPSPLVELLVPGAGNQCILESAAAVVFELILPVVVVPEA